ncbi:murein biosynthesis integral membrane protein MurJ [Bradyrhizobium sp. LHD-71]|uniref:murein biosynthesis integral membrane protein MurJ n=1 Tax=Bradyrhizobium sp. LHD-71 TaxID=3072141 RepID=UPI00280F6C02|nr:murein biosynthesis integral membrane protein MurJ [Bradyrhizobium sp. LHD-71]MDQ8728439.1 murein biosynthesis integral membrane protein MurJ [Bradyrhizobium sp. LHD-71]
MFRGIFTFGGFTLLSRIAGFARDIVMAAILGAGPLADAFVVAQRLPNHFRAIFAEGAFNAAFVPAYAHLRGGAGEAGAKRFADRIFTMLLIVQALLLVLALVFMPQLITLLAPGFSDDPERRSLAIELTRITFPYLLLITVVTLYGAILNVMNRYATAAAAPILLNLSIMVALALAAFFPTAGHAAAWGVLVAGVLEVLLLAVDVGRQGALPRLTWPQFDADVRSFFRSLAPATIGSMGPQIAAFADTIIGSFLATGALAALYYADRLNQLPIGVIGVAAGTVLLPAMSKLLAAGDEQGAANAQRRVFNLTLLLTMPFLVAFLVVPDTIMRALFVRGAFSPADAANAASTLAAYAVGLLPFVLLRSAVASFLARKDTATPAKAALIGVGVNIAAKVALVGTLAQAGLALATAIGAWVNLLIVLWLAARAKYLTFDRSMQLVILKFAVAALLLTAALWATARFGAPQLLSNVSAGREELTLALLVIVGAVTYVVAIIALFGRRWMTLLIR